MYQKWGELIREFHVRGGTLGYAADDPFTWNTTGIANVRELQLMRETGLNTLEVLRAATLTSARILGRDDLGLVQTGFKADLAIVDGNPLHNLRFLYAFGALTMDGNEMVRRGGVRWTVKDGVVFDNRALIADVVAMVEASKKNWVSPVQELMR